MKSFELSRERALLALDGLSVGDALGNFYLYAMNPIEPLIADRFLPPTPWKYTDDTEMALGILEVLRARGGIDQDLLATVFARRYKADDTRDYGASACDVLEEIANGGSWRAAAARVFGGRGSMGNGGAMRVAPLAAWFADDLARVAKEARLSAQVTHAHEEGQAGAIAIAVATASACSPSRGILQLRKDLFESALEYCSAGSTRTGIEAARLLDAQTNPEQAAKRLGNGSTGTAPETVPFCLWCAARHLDCFEDAIWTAIEAGGDMDTISAIIGGIVALAAGRESIPEHWIEAREVLRFK